MSGKLSCPNFATGAGNIPLTKNLKNRNEKAVSSKKTRDEYTVVLEDLRSEFRIFGEGLQGVRSDLEFVKEELALIRHNQVTRDEFKFLEARVARLERIKK